MIRTINAVVRIDRQMPFTIAQVKQNDEVILILRVTNNGDYLDLSNQSIILRTEINGKTHVQLNNISVSSDSVTIICDNEHFQTVGLSRFELELTDLNGTTRSGDFCILINKLIDGEVEGGGAIFPIISPTSITMDLSYLTLSLGDTQQLTYRIYPSNATNKSVSWTSSNSSIVSVSNGKVTAKGVGKAVITVSTIDGRYSSNCEISVKAVSATGIVLDTSEVVLSYGEYFKINATVYPANATNKTVIWESNNTSVAVVNNGVVTYVGQGDATITATTYDGKHSATCRVQCLSNEIYVSGVSLNYTSSTLNINETLQLYATVYPTNATNKTVVWESNNINVATVSGNGLVKAISKGNAIITVTTANGGYFENCYVNVEEVSTTIPVSSVNISQSSLNLNVGNTAQLYATIYPTNATNQELTWSVMPSGIVEVSSDGVVRAISSGTATITVSSSNGKTNSCTVNVEALTLGGIVSSVESLSVGYGETTTFTVCLSERPTNTQSMTISSGACNINPSTLSFTPANWNVPQTITITPIRLGDGTIIITSGNNTKEIALSIGESYATVILSKTDVSVRTGYSSSFAVSLSSQPTSDQYVSISVNNNNATISTSTLIFTSSNWNISQTITVNGVAEGSSLITISSNNSTKYVYVTVSQPSTDEGGDNTGTGGGSNTGGSTDGGEDGGEIGTVVGLADTDIRNKVPYLATYHFDGTIKTNQTLTLDIFVTDYYGRSYTMDNNHYVYTIIVKCDGKDIQVYDSLQAGNHSITIGSFSQEGTYHFSILAKDQYGRCSHELFNYVRVKNDVSHNNAYTITSSDLSSYGITYNKNREEKMYVNVSSANGNTDSINSIMSNAYNQVSVSSGKYLCLIPSRDGSTYQGKNKDWNKCLVKYASDYNKTSVANECANNRNQINRLIQDKVNAGYNKIIFYNAVFVIDNQPIEIPSGIDFDMNGATFKTNPFTGNGALIMRMTDCIDTNVYNGTLEGDYFAHDYANSTSNSEWVSGFEMGGSCRYCNVHDLTVKDITGYGIQNSISNTSELGYSFFNPIVVGELETGDIDRENGNAKSCTYRTRTKDYVNISNAIGKSDFLTVSIYLNYQGNEFDTWNQVIYFYDSSRNFIKAVDAYQYRQVKIPTNAYYIKVVWLGQRIKADWSIHCHYMRVPTHCVFERITVDNARCVGMAQGQMKDFLVKDCTITNSGQSSATCAYDAEDGWDGMQDAFFENFNITQCPANGFLTCAGHNFVINNMTTDGVYMWERSRWAEIKNSNFVSAIIRGGGEANIVEHGITRFYNNTITGLAHQMYLMSNIGKNCIYTNEPQNGIFINTTIGSQTHSETIINKDVNNPTKDDRGTMENADNGASIGGGTTTDNSYLSPSNVNVEVGSTSVISLYNTTQTITNAYVSNNYATITSTQSGSVTIKGVSVGTDVLSVVLSTGKTLTANITITSNSSGGGSTGGGTSSNLVTIQYPASKKANPSEWNALGDSITYGYNVGGNSNAYPSRVNYSVSMRVNNYGITGTCISTGFNDLCSTGVSQSFINRYDQMSESADMITVFGGINDFLCSVPIGSLTDTTNTTFYGALNNLVSGLKSRYNRKRIVFFTPIRIGGYTNVNGVNATLKDYRNAIVTVCNNNQLEVLDLYSLDSLDASLSIGNYMGDWDTTHPNGTGQQIIADYIISQMLNGSESGGGTITENPQLSPSYVSVAVGGTASVNVVNTAQVISSAYSKNGYVNVNYSSYSLNITGAYVGTDYITVCLSGGTTLSLTVDVYSQSQTDNPYLSATDLTFNKGTTTTIYLRGTTQTITNAYTSNNCASASYTSDSILLTGNSAGNCVLNVILSSGNILKTNVSVLESMTGGTSGAFDDNNPTIYSSTEKTLTLVDSSKTIEYCYLAVGNATIVSKTNNSITIKATSDGIDYLNYVFTDGTNGCITLNCVNDGSSGGDSGGSTESGVIFNNDTPTVAVNDSTTLTLKDSSQTLRTVYVATGNATISASDSKSVTLTGKSVGTEYLNYVILNSDGTETSGSIIVTVTAEGAGGNSGSSGGGTNTTTNTFNTIYPVVAVGETLTITLNNTTPSISGVSFNSSIANITTQTGTQLTFEGLEKGSATVIVTLSDGSTINLTLNVTESTTSDDSPYLYPSSITITIGATATFNLYGTTKVINNAYTVSGATTLSNYSSTSVNVTGLSEGTDYLNVTLTNNKQVSATIYVVSSGSSGGSNDGSSSSEISNASETALTQQYSTSHEATPNIANPPSGGYNWKYAPRINPDGSFPISSWNAFGHWMTTYKVEGASYYDNVGLLLQDPKAWIWNSSTKSWDVLSSDFEWGNWYLEDFWDDGSGYIAGTTQWETGVSGNHSTWVKIKQTSETSGRCFHPWGYQKNWRSNSSWANNGQPYIVTKIDFKLVKWDENGSDNLDSAQLLVNSGGDWWRNVGDVWQPDWSTNRDMCVGKYIKATRELKRAWATNLPNNWGYGLPTDGTSSSSGSTNNGSGSSGGSSGGSSSGGNSSGGTTSGTGNTTVNGLVTVNYPATNKGVPTIWNALGDSITYGAGLSSPSAERYQTIASNSAGVSYYYNYGISGTCVSDGYNTNLTDITTDQSFINRYEEMAMGADLITVFGGVNDHNLDQKIGSENDTDTKTFYGALNTLINGLKSMYPNGRIVFITPFKTSNYNGTNQAGAKLIDYRNAIVTACNNKQIEVLDLFTDSNIAYQNYSSGYFTYGDYFHPTSAGHQYIGNLIVSKLF